MQEFNRQGTRDIAEMNEQQRRTGLEATFRAAQSLAQLAEQGKQFKYAGEMDKYKQGGEGAAALIGAGTQNIFDMLTQKESMDLYKDLREDWKKNMEGLNKEAPAATEEPEPWSYDSSWTEPKTKTATIGDFTPRLFPDTSKKKFQSPYLQFLNP